LKLIELIAPVQKAFYEGKLTVGHTLEIARPQPSFRASENVALEVETGCF
jgi:hypothetical protein